MTDLDRLRAQIGNAPLTVERIKNVVSRQTRFVIFNESGEVLFEGRLEVAAAWLDGFGRGRTIPCPAGETTRNQLREQATTTTHHNKRLV